MTPPRPVILSLQFMNFHISNDEKHIYKNVLINLWACTASLVCHTTSAASATKFKFTYEMLELTFKGGKKKSEME